MVRTNELVTKVNALGEALSNELFEREEEIHGLLLALLSKTHIFMIGPPGTGKTKLGDRAMARISGANLGGLLFTAHTRPEEVLGPLDIPALRNGVLRHNTANYLPSCHVFKGDEIWKARLLPNVLLEALEERRFQQDGTYQEMPLWTFIGTSNELPADESLDAVYDRFMQRFDVKPLAERANRIRMLRARADNTEPKQPEPLLTKDEIEAAQGEVLNVHVPNDVLELIDDVGQHLTERNIDPSNRRLSNCVRLVQAEAWLDERKEAATSDVQVLTAVGWKTPEQIAEVEKVVLTMSNPLYAKAIEIATSVGAYSNDVEAAIKETDPKARARMANEVQTKMLRASRDIRDFSNEKLSRRTQQLMVKAQRTMLTCSERLMTEVMGLSPKAAKMQAAIMAGEEEEE